MSLSDWLLERHRQASRPPDARISRYLADKFLDCKLRGISYQPPDVLYFALYTAKPDSPDIGMEVDAFKLDASSTLIENLPVVQPVQTEESETP